MLWPHKGPQMEFHRSPAFELLYGGAAGGGKTWSLLAEGSRQAGNAEYKAVLFRRTFPQLNQADGPIEKSRKLFRRLGSFAGRQWNFNGGGRFMFSHMNEREDYLDHDGAAYAYIAFDELAHFYEMQYRYLFSRARVAVESGLRTYVRAATNPPRPSSPGFGWIKRRWAPWLDKTHPRPAKSGELRYYALVDEEEKEVEKGYPNSWSRSFIQAFAKDNPSLDESYLRNLDSLPRFERLRLKHGLWDIDDSSGAMFDRKWFRVLDTMPPGCKRYRFWDMAATVKKMKSDDPDYTATTLMGVKDGMRYMDSMRDRVTPADFKRWLLRTAIAEPDVEVAIEHEGGASGVYVADDLLDAFAKINRTLRVIRPQGDKATRAMPWSAQAEQGKIVLIKNHVTGIEEVLDELQMFPNGDHDDIVDSISGAWRMTATEAEYSQNSDWSW